MRLCTLIVFVIAVLTGAVNAEQRIALVVGNSNYATVTSLENAVNDAELIGQSLTKVGFKTTVMQDATQLELKRAIAQFGRDLRAAGPDTVGLFYYAGHGIQSFGTNYLLPVDAALNDAADLDLVGLEAAAVLRQMASARNKTNIVILDACRNNPFEDIADLNDNGLAEMKAPTGTYLAYATAPGAVALDGVGENSPFTAALAKSIETEGAPIEQVFKQVRVSVLEETKGFQTPWDTSSLTQDFVFKPGKARTAAEIAEEQLWSSVELSRDPVQILLYLRGYPSGRFEEQAREMLAEIMRSEAAKTSTETVEAPPVATGPSDEEIALIEAARKSGSLDDYQAYLDAFPEGVFAEMASIEIATLNESAESQEQASLDPEARVVEPETSDAATQIGEPEPVLFDQPMQSGVPEIVGKTILEAAQGSPLYPPIEGLPETVWKDQNCSNCHQWTRDDLCAQANTYLAQSAPRALQKLHPYGGSFKRNLRSWAEGGCL